MASSSLHREARRQTSGRGDDSSPVELTRAHPLGPAPANAGLPRLFVSHDPDLDVLSAVEFGRVDDGQPSERWEQIADDFAYLHLGPADRSPAIGFRVIRFSDFDAEHPALERIWDEPLFDAPQLGLLGATAGGVVLAARGLYGEAPSINRAFFNDACGRSGQPALRAWLACLQSGDSMAHFALGYTLYEEGRYHEAYRHLRYYAEISPGHPWNLTWLGRAAEAIGEIEEARAAYGAAIDLTAGGGPETDAPERLAALRAA